MGKEMKVKTEEMPEPSRKKRKTCHDSHYRSAIAFAGDEKAMTTDPKQMERNYTFPWNAVTITDGQVSLEQVDGDGVLIVSPEFAASFPGGVYKKLFESSTMSNLPDANNKREKLECITYRSVATANFSILTPIPASVTLALEHKEDSLNESHKVKESMVAVPEIECLPIAEFSDAGVVVSLGSIKRLAPLQELNGELVDFGMFNFLKDFPIAGYVLARAWVLYLFKKEDPISTHSRDLLYKMVTKWGKEPNLLQKKYLVLPVCRESHWILVIVCNPFPTQSDAFAATESIAQGCNPESVSKHLYKRWTDYDENVPNAVMIFVLDSKYKYCKRHYANFSQFHDDTVKYVFKGLRALHQKHWEKTGCGIIVDSDVFEWKHAVNPENSHIIQRNRIHHHSLDVTEQPNGKDCGVYIIAFVKKWFDMTENNCKKWIGLLHQNLDDWFDPATATESRQNIYRDIIECCKQTHPRSLTLLEQCDPFATQELITVQD